MKTIRFDSHPIVKAARARQLQHDGHILLPFQMEAMRRFLLEKQELEQLHAATAEMNEARTQ